LSGVAASLRKAATQSKDPYKQTGAGDHGFAANFWPLAKPRCGGIVTLGSFDSAESSRSELSTPLRMNTWLCP
jgi:hypothetical protein